MTYHSDYDTLPYHVDLWGSHPDDDNDDCWTGTGFATLDEAIRAFEHPDTITCAHFQGEIHSPDSVWITMSGPDIEQCRRLRPDRKKRRNDDDDWRREIAMEAGMLHGVDAYNDILGSGEG